MGKKVGDKNFFKKDERYLLKVALDYLTKKGIEFPHSWNEGGGLKYWADKLELEPVYITTGGGRSYYDGLSMYKLVHALEEKYSKKKAKSIGQQTPPAVTKESTTTTILSQQEPKQITIDDVINSTQVLEESAKALYKAICDCCETLNEIKEKLGGYYYG